MSTRPCPHCHEIIPSDLDYCPYCNESTHETLQTADDIALKERHETIGRTALAEAPLDSISETGEPGAAPIPVIDRCIMCNMSPAVVNDYCLECQRKLNMGPEQWDLIKQEANQRKMIAGVIAAIVLIALIVFVASIVHHHRAPAAVPNTATSATQ